MNLDGRRSLDLLDLDAVLGVEGSSGGRHRPEAVVSSESCRRGRLLGVLLLRRRVRSSETESFVDRLEDVSSAVVPRSSSSSVRRSENDVAFARCRRPRSFVLVRVGVGSAGMRRRIRMSVMVESDAVVGLESRSDGSGRVPRVRRRREGSGEARDGRRDDASRGGSRVVGRRGVGRLGSPVSRRVRFPSGPDRSSSSERSDLSLLVLVGSNVSSSFLGGRDGETGVLRSEGESSIERGREATSVSSLASSSRTRANSRPLSNSTSSRLRTQSSRERLPSQTSSVSEDPSSVNVVSRLLDLESEPMSAGSDGCRSRERWNS